MTPPNSVKPKPKDGQAGTAEPNLSKPAAKPKGLGNVRPKTVEDKSLVEYN